MTDDLSSSGVDSPSQPSALPSPAAIPDPQAALTARILQGVRSWGIVSIVFGVIQLAAIDLLSAPWGIILILVGVASFFFRSASMYPVYAVVLGWAAIGNFTTRQWGWVALGALQVYWAFRVLQQFRQYRKVALPGATSNEGARVTPPSEKRAERLFPWTGCLLGAVSSLAFFSIVGGVFISAILQPGAGLQGLDLWAFLMELALSLGILGGAFGLASLLARYQKRGLAIGALISGGLVLCANVALLMIPAR